MKVGIVKEIKNSENRVAIIPSNVPEFICRGHEVRIESGAGEGSGYSDEEYREADVPSWAIRLVLKPDEI